MKRACLSKDKTEGHGKPLKRCFEKFALPDIYKLLVLQVSSGIKNAATLDGIRGDDLSLLSQINLLLNQFGLCSRIVEQGHILKVIFGRKEGDVFLLYALQDKVFKEKRFQVKYGELLGYPACCTKQYRSRVRAKKSFLFTSMRLSDPVGAAWAIDYRFNILSKTPLIFHMPCTRDCAASRSLAERAFRLYEAYDPVLARTILGFLKEPALVFNVENYVRFNGRLARNRISYSGMQHVHRPCFADADGLFDNVATDNIVQAIQGGDNISFHKEEFIVFRNKRLLKKVKYADQQFQVYNFC